MNKRGQISNEISSETLRNLILFLLVLAVGGIVYLIVTRLLNV